MKKIIYLVTLLLVIGVAAMIFYISRNESENNIKVQVIQFDIMDDSEKIVKEVNVQLNDIINLEMYDGNNIKVLEITDENVKISRDAIRYEIISQTSLFSGEVKEYVETVVETIEYDNLITINIDSRHPFGPAYDQPRYHYNIKFIK
jgi:hypothetical protein